MNKRFALIILSTAIILQSFADEKEKPVKSTINNVTVYLNGAEINRSGNVTLSPGETYLLFDGLSPNIDPNSIQVQGKGNFTILSVTHRLNYLKDNPKTKEITEIEDSIRSLEIQIEYQQGLQNVYKNEEELLLANKSIGNKDVGVDAIDLLEMADFFRKRLSQIKSAMIEAKYKLVTLQDEINKLKAQLQALYSQRNRSTGEIVVGVTANEKTPAKFQLSYFTGNAGWSPAYDIRADDSQSTVRLDYKANLHQNTGVDWENVKLTLSTVNPTRSGTKPSLSPWVLRFRNPAELDKMKMRAVSGAAPSARKQEEASYEMQLTEKDAYTTAAYTEIRENRLSAEFEIKLPYTVPADGKEHTVDIQQYELKAEFSHFAIPKNDPDAFLISKLSGWESYNLLSGAASIYYEGAFVGKSYINTRSTGDTLDLSFGRDQGIVITREKLKDFTSKKLIGTNKKETFAYQITIRNNKKKPVEIVIEDQLPVSSDKEIEVEPEELSGASHNKDTGKLSWGLNIAPSENKSIKLIYSVKYPKDKTITNL